MRQARFLAYPREKRHALVGQAHLWQMKRDFQIAFLTDVGLKPQHYLLDIGCGTLRGGIPVIRYLKEGHYFGVDARAEVIEEARKELEVEKLTGKNPVLTSTPTISSLDLGRTFNYVWAFSVLFHMTDEIVDDCFAFVERHLEPHGVFYANVNIGAHAPKKWKEFPVMWRTLAFYERLGDAHALSVEDMGPLSAFGHVTGIAEHDDQRVLKMRPARADERSRQESARSSVSAGS